MMFRRISAAAAVAAARPATAVTAMTAVTHGRGTAPGRRHALLAAAVLGGAMAWPAFQTEARAQAAWPTERPIRLIVPYATGGFGDLRARQVATRLSKALGQQIIVDNKPGAGGVLGTDLLAKAAPDGYTLGTGHPAPLATNVTLMKSLPYDPAKDIAPVILIESSPLILMAGPSLKVNSVAELIAEAKKDPGKLTFASSGIGGAHHLSGELFDRTAGISLTHVPYKGGAPAAADLLAGHVSMMFEMGYAALPSIKAGRIRPLAVTSRERIAVLPDVPTMLEAGVKGFTSANWQGIIAPAGTPPDIIARLNKELNTILADPEMRELISSVGSQVAGGTPGSFGALIRSETTKWGEVIRAAKIEAQ